MSEAGASPGVAAGNAPRADPSRRTLGRREIVGAVGVVVLASAAGGAWYYRSGSRALSEAIERVVNGRVVTVGRVQIDLPGIAENGNTVPLKVDVESPMSKDDFVKTVHVFADGNPLPNVASFHFSPRAGKAYVSTRIRLARDQNIIAIAEMNDGSLFRASRAVEVTVGGCGA